MSTCPGVQCPGVQVSSCPDVQVSRCPGVQMSRCPVVQMSRSLDVKVSRCQGVLYVFHASKASLNYVLNDNLLSRHRVPNVRVMINAL